MSTPIALWLAEKLEDPESAHGYRLVANNAANELRRLQQENEQLKAQRKPLTDEKVAQAYAMAQVCLDIHAVLGCKWGDNVYLTISQLIAQPEQEPVAWRTFDGEGGYEYRTYEENEQYAQKWEQLNPKHKDWVEPLYTTPPQRKPLTDEEITEVWRELKFKNEAWSDLDFARAIEAKLKEKNDR